MSLTFALFAPRKGTQSVERGEGILFYFERCYWHYLLANKFSQNLKRSEDDSNNTLLLWYAVLLRL